MRAVQDELNVNERALRSIQAPEQVVFDPLTELWEVSPGAFKPQSDGSISVDLEEIQRIDNKPLTEGYPRIPRAVGLVAHTLLRLNGAKLFVTHSPLADNDYHGEARGKPSRSDRKDLAETCQVIIALQGDAIRRHQDEKLAREAQSRLASS